MGFGNPFSTHFDHGIPFVNMQDLWVQPGPSNAFDLSLLFEDRSQDSRDGEHGQNTVYALWRRLRVLAGFL
jgi:hypothetical protein